MGITFESRGDFENTTKWLKSITGKSPLPVANSIAKQGEQRLAARTPRSTGETALGWRSKVTTNRNVTEITWYNVAHPGTTANVAKMIELGHGTGTGGYVPPNPYIKEAMKPIWKTASDKVSKELMN